jgi:hypothetical protein
MKEKLHLDDELLNIPVERQVKVRDLLIDVPLRYKCSAINILFPISTVEAKKIIKTKKIKPLELFPGRSFVCITLFDFYKGPVGKYTEMTLSIPVAYKPKLYLPFFSLVSNLLLDKVDFFVFSVAQSSKLAIEHGMAITGYPRYNPDKLIDIDYRDDGEFIYANVYGEGKQILDLKIQKPKKEIMRKEIYDTYYTKNDKIFKILMETHVVVGKSGVVDFKTGDHELGQLLKNLKIQPKAIDTRYYRDTVKIIYSPKELENI